MPRMRVLKPHTFDQKPVLPGEEYDAQGSDADIVQALGWAETIDQPEAARPRRRGRYANRAMTAEA